MIQNTSKLTPMQVDLLRLFSRPMSDQEVLEIKHLIVDYYAGRIDGEVDELWESGKVNQQLLDERLNASRELRR